GDGSGVGVGWQLFSTNLFDAEEIDLALDLLRLRRTHFGDGVIAVDGGANIGVHTIEWANLMTRWGRVIAIEAQERLYYALAGNIALNNCFNASALNAAVGARSGAMRIPVLDYGKPASLGSLELKPSTNPGFIGQAVDHQAGATAQVSLVALDDLGFPRLDFVKLDVEGMELEALEGGRRVIETCRPILLVEHVKSKPGVLQAWLQARGYRCFETPMNILAVHQSDPSLASISPEGKPTL
ncbi:MAG: FkbM family methyltransferase, partial [Alphaproteobacteria bacterium]|nr:FkbM family methyltransferase [Alphaproteobacteria bacterium]